MRGHSNSEMNANAAAPMAIANASEPLPTRVSTGYRSSIRNASLRSIQDIATRGIRSRMIKVNVLSIVSSVVSSVATTSSGNLPAGYLVNKTYEDARSPCTSRPCARTRRDLGPGDQPHRQLERHVYADGADRRDAVDHVHLSFHAEGQGTDGHDRARARAAVEGRERRRGRD